jgi:uncharacterized cofD-like protein
MSRRTPKRAKSGVDSSLTIRLVAIGGGTGLATILKGLKHYERHRETNGKLAKTRLPVSIAEMAAVVTVTDDGGSSGRLRKDFNILPPGDIRNCIVALSEDEALLSRLFQYRFTAGQGLEGHSFGNLFVAALTSITGDFSEAVKVSSAVLNTRGQIFPCTTSNVQLDALMDDGSRVRGETNITASKRRVVDLRLVPANAKPLPKALEAISNADVITIGPGSLFTSLIPNLLVKGIPEAIAKSRAMKVFICNLMTQANESLGLSASEHIRAIVEHAGYKIFDYALVNTRSVSPALREKYAQEGASQIVYDPDQIEALGVKPVPGDFLEEAGVARHATDQVAKALFQLYQQHHAGRTKPHRPLRKAAGR